MRTSRRYGTMLTAFLVGMLLSGGAVFADEKAQAGRGAEQLTGTSAPAYGDGEFVASRKVIQTIESALDTAVRDGLNLADSSTLGDVVAGMGLVEPTEPLMAKSIQELTAEAKANLAKKGNRDEAEIKAKLMEEAKAKWPLTPLKSKVDFVYTVGNKSRHVKGLFITVNAKSMRVDDTHVTLLDLPDELRVSFDPKFNRAVCEAYVNGKIRLMERDAGKALQGEFERLLQAQDAKNEANGYVYVRVDHLWTTPRAYLNFVLPKYVKLSQEALAKAAAEKAEWEKQMREENASAADGKNGPQVDEGVYRKVLDSQRALREKVSKVGGVDSEQGFQFATFGTPRRNVQILFSRNATLKQENERDVVTFTGKLPYRVDFYYDRDLDMVVEHYASTSLKKTGKDAKEAKPSVAFTDDFFIKMMKRFHNLCGLCFEEKTLGIDNISDHILNDDSLPLPSSFIPKDTAKVPSCICYKWFIAPDSSPMKCTSEDDTPADNLYVMHWLGKETLITILFTFDDKADNAFADFYIIRERLKK